MNAGVNLSNMVNSVPNKLMQNNQVINMDKGAFLKLMTMSTNKNQGNPPSQISNVAVTELNIMDLIGKSSFINSTDINSASFDFNEEVNSLNEADNQKDTKFEAALANFMLMINYLNPDNEKINIERLKSEVIDANSSSFDFFDFNSEEVNSLNEADNQKDMKFGAALANFMPMTNYLNLDNEKINIEKLRPEAVAANNLYMGLKEADNFKYEIPDIAERADALKPVMESVPEISVQAEKLIAEIEGKKDNLKNEIDFNFNSALASRESLVQTENKIITVSDESSQIKPQVLSQVKDKIVFMAGEGSKSGGIKQVTMELQPHNLGKVDIKMTFEDNKITVEIKALNEETQKVLSSGAGELAKILSKTTESSINVVVKSPELQHEHQIFNYNQDNEQKYNEDYGQQNGHNRQRNYYYKEDNKENDDEDSIFSELINLRNLKLQT